jgi:putative DNA primase/helicase
MATTSTKATTPPALTLAPPADWGMETTAARARRERATAVLAPLIEQAAAEHAEPGVRLAAWAKLKANAADVAELLHVAGSDDLRDLLAAAGAVRGAAADYRALDAAMARAIKAVEKAQAQAAKAWAAEQARTGPPRLSAQGAASRLLDLIPGAAVGGGWELSDNGVVHVSVDDEGVPSDKVKVAATRPILLCGRAVDVDSGEYSVEVAWTNEDGRIGRAWTPRADVMDGRKLISLAAQGAPVCSPTAADLSRFLDWCDSTWAAKLPQRAVSVRLGHIRGGFLRGTGWHPAPVATPEGADPHPAPPTAPPAPPVHLTPPGGYEVLTAAVHERGTWEGWLEAWAVAAQRPVARLVVYTALASVLLPWTTDRGCVLDIWGETSIGKTTALNLAASVWAQPRGYVGKWASTMTYRERSAAVLSCLPLLLDDTRQIAPKERDLIGQTVYQLADGQGKGRGFVFGAQARAVWCSFTISTGESPLLGTSQDEGARARCLSVEGAPFGDRAEAVTINRVTDRHYGHLGARFVGALLARGKAAVSALWEERDAAWAQALAPAGGLAARLAAHIAAIEVAAMIAHEDCGLPAGSWEEIATATAVAGAAAAHSGADADKPLAALRAVLSRATAQQSSFWGRHAVDRDNEAKTPPGGFVGQWKTDDGDRNRWAVVAVATHVLRRWLAEDRYDAPGVIAQWAARGWLALPSSGTGHDKPVKVDGQSMRCVCVLRAAVVSAMGEAE